MTEKCKTAGTQAIASPSPFMERGPGGEVKTLDSPFMERGPGGEVKTLDSPFMEREVKTLDSPFMEREVKTLDSPFMRGEVQVTGHAPVSPEKLNLARTLRKLPTAAEALAWELLRNRRCSGLKFRRQQVILGLIVDFYCAEERLAIELDGGVHENQRDYDQARDAILAQAGVRIVRIRNEELTIERLLEITSPPNPLSMNGEGEARELT